jgi:hypothetical protein
MKSNGLIWDFTENKKYSDCYITWLSSGKYKRGIDIGCFGYASYHDLLYFINWDRNNAKRELPTILEYLEFVKDTVFLPKDSFRIINSFEEFVAVVKSMKIDNVFPKDTIEQHWNHTVSERVLTLFVDASKFKNKHHFLAGLTVLRYADERQSSLIVPTVLEYYKKFGHKYTKEQLLYTAHYHLNGKIPGSFAFTGHSLVGGTGVVVFPKDYNIQDHRIDGVYNISQKFEIPWSKAAGITVTYNWDYTKPLQKIKEMGVEKFLETFYDNPQEIKEKEQIVSK